MDDENTYDLVEPIFELVPVSHSAVRLLEHPVDVLSQEVRALARHLSA